MAKPTDKKFKKTKDKFQKAEKLQIHKLKPAYSDSLNTMPSDPFLP